MLATDSKSFHLRLFSEEPGPEVVLKEENRQEVIENESLDAINKTEIQESPVIHGANMQEYMYMIPREKIQEKIKKHNIDRLVRSDFQKYQQGKAQGVLFKAMIASSIKMVMDRYNDQLQEKIEKLEKIEKKIKEQLQEKRDKCNDHLQEYALLSSILYGVWTLCLLVFCNLCLNCYDRIGRKQFKNRNDESTQPMSGSERQPLPSSDQGYISHETSSDFVDTKTVERNYPCALM